MYLQRTNFDTGVKNYLDKNGLWIGGEVNPEDLYTGPTWQYDILIDYYSTYNHYPDDNFEIVDTVPTYIPVPGDYFKDEAGDTYLCVSPNILNKTIREHVFSDGKVPIGFSLNLTKEDGQIWYIMPNEKLTKYNHKI